LSAAAAYRADTSGRDLAFAEDDGAWIAIGTILDHASRVPDDFKRQLVCDAVELAETIVPVSELSSRAAREWPGDDRTPTEIIVLVAERAETAGCLNLAAFILDSLIDASTDLSAIQRGRVLAKRARVAWKLGEIDAATDRYRQLDILGRRIRSPELRVRANIGYVALAQMRGNYPAMEKFAKTAARLAEEAGLYALARNAYDGLTIAAGARRDVERALLYGWRVYELSLGDPVDEAAILQNIGQALLDAGHLGAARSAFIAVVSRAIPPHVLLPALGGLANASARMGDAESATWAAREVSELGKSLAPRYALAQALVECAAALVIIGETMLAESCRVAGLEMANRYEFHEIVYRGDEIEARRASAERPTAAMLGKAAARVADKVIRLAPERLPAHTNVVGAA